MGDNGMKFIIGPNGESHMAFKSGNMTMADGKVFTNIGDVAFGSDGSTYLKMGNAIIGPDGKTHLAFGDNPTFLM